MALDLNPTTFAAVVEKASHDAANHPRWLQAIARAIVEISDNPWIARGELHGLVIGSPSGNVYAANGTCQCKAHEFGQPCWHRAAARIVRLCDEREAAQQAEQCPNCCASAAYADRCPAAQIAADQATMPALRPLGERLAHARAQMDELFA